MQRIGYKSIETCVIRSASSGTHIKDRILVLSIGILLCWGFYLAFYFAPLLRHNGLTWWSQKIFYLHLPSAWGAMAGLLLVLVGSVGYLITRRERWDVIAVAAAEPSLLYATLVLVTGPLWARPSWNVYWKWEDPRLMSFFAWWLILIGYHLLRNFNEDGTSRRITSAALGIVGAISVPFVFYSVKLGRSLHPKPIEVNAQVRFTTIVFLCAFSLLFVLLFQLRYRLECQRNRLWECEQSLPDD